MNKKTLLIILLLLGVSKSHGMLTLPSLLPLARPIKNIINRSIDKVIGGITSAKQCSIKAYRLFRCKSNYERAQIFVEYGDLQGLKDIIKRPNENGGILSKKLYLACKNEDFAMQLVRYFNYGTTYVSEEYNDECDYEDYFTDDDLKIINLLIEYDIFGFIFPSQTPQYLDQTISLFTLACEFNNFTMVSFVLRHNFPKYINMVDDYGNTPLHSVCASKYPSSEIIKLLLQLNANVNQRNKVGATPLSLCSRVLEPSINEDQKQAIKLLITHGADIEAIRYGETCFHNICLYGDSELIELCVKHGVNINVRSTQGKTALHWLLYRLKDQNENYAIFNNIETLILCGADVNAIDDDNVTLLHLACKVGNPAIIQLLLDNGAYKSINEVDTRDEKRSLEIVLNSGESENSRLILRKLLLYGAKIEGVDLNSIDRVYQDEFKRCLQCIYILQELDVADKVDYISVLVKEDSQVDDATFYQVPELLKEIISFAVRSSLVKILLHQGLTEDDMCNENVFKDTLFYKLNKKAQDNSLLEGAILQTFDIKDKRLLREENNIDFIEHVVQGACFEGTQEIQEKIVAHRNFLEQEKRSHFAFKNEDFSSNTTDVDTDDRTLHVPTSFLKLAL